MPSSGMARKLVALNNINPNVKIMHDNVQSALTKRALEIERELEKGVFNSFTEVIRADISDSQAMGQKPLTFIRQVLTVCAYPELLKDDLFPSDVKKHANDILDDCGGRSIGAYSYSEGVDIIRTHVAQYIERRDGFHSNSEDIILSPGASEALRSVLNILNYPTNGKKIGVLVPVPRDPMYTAALTEFGMIQIDYYLDEECSWNVSINELKTAIESARKYCIPKAIFIINPGNPTGAVLTRKNIVEIIKFALQEKLVLLADEVYQFNIYGEGVQFHSFKKVMMEMGSPYSGIELVSFMSGSKGFMGECGLRAGYCEMVNFHPDVVKVYRKSICVKMCPSVLGQTALDCLVCPPNSGESSHDLFVQEKTEVLQSLKERALLVTNSLDSIQDIQCSSITGAIYAFPRIFLPEKAINKAQSLGQAPDFFYTMQLLENTGVCTVPGNKFGQLPGTYHFRITILPEVKNLKKMLELIRNFHCQFLEEYNIRNNLEAIE